MSKPGDKTKKGSRGLPAFDELEKAVAGAASQLRGLRAQLDQAEVDGREMRELLRQFTEGEEDPSRLMTRLSDLETENQELLVRLKMGKEGVERLLARIRFLEEQA